MEHHKHGDVPPGILSMAVGGVDEDLIIGIARSNPQFVLGILKSMSPGEIIEVINTNKDFVVKIAEEMPPEILARLVREQPDVVATFVEETGFNFFQEIVEIN